jgi:putative aldouronate transport system substrate-binding protein
MFDYAGPSDNDPKNPNSLITAARKTNAKASIDFSPPPQGPGGRGSWAWGSAGHVMMFGRQIAKDDAKLKRILGVFETVLTDVEFGTRMALGDEGTMYELTDKSQGIAGGWRWIGDYTDPNRTDAEGLGAYPYVGMPDPSIITNVNVPDPALRKISEDYGKYTYVDYFGKSGVVEGSDQYAANLQNLKVKAYSDIVTGARPVSAFDDFVHQFNAAGGAQLQKAADKLRQEVPTKGN